VIKADVKTERKRLASEYILNNEFIKAFNLYKLHAEQGDAYAQNAIGNIYGRLGKNQNCKKFFKWLKLAAEQGHVISQKELGYAYLSYGSCSKQDVTEALKWLNLAAEHGYVHCQFLIAKTYYLGNGVEKNYKEALKWYLISVEHGNNLTRASFKDELSKELTSEQIEQATNEAKTWTKIHPPGSMKR
jgi:TPR repeat protein